jgi:hypothetical protein
MKIILIYIRSVSLKEGVKTTSLKAVADIFPIE